MGKKPKENSPEDLLAKMRSGYKLPLELIFNDLKVPCRLVPGDEMAKAISNAKSGLKIPEGHDRGLLEGQAVMRATLEVATTIDSTTYLGERFLKLTTDDELSVLHDQYQSKCKAVDIEFKTLSEDQIADIIGEIKKKSANPNAYYMWQLAAVGKYFLEQLQATGKSAGGN